MKKLFISAVAVLVSIAAMAQSSFTVGSYNMRYRNEGDAERGNGWATRSKGIFDLINYERWDIFGGQELLHDQVQDLKNNLDGYDYIGVAREDGAEDGEYAAIFYKKDRMTCLEKGWFWISETPEVVGSIGWDADQCRICTWGKFEDNKTKWQFWFFNLHMDHVGVEARREGAKLIARKITEMCGNEPAMVSGDFNVDQNNEAYKTIVSQGVLEDSYEKAEKRFSRNGTFNSFNPNLFTQSRIDHIFVTKHAKVSHYATLTDGYWIVNPDTPGSIKGEAAPQEIKFEKYSHRCPSDHYPVMIRLTLEKK